MNEIENFIQRRFPENSHWCDGNCYYFALILKDRFPNSIVYYDVIYGHFITKIDGDFYDWKGKNEFYANKDNSFFLVEWDKFKEYDDIQEKRIIKYCIK